MSIFLKIAPPQFSGYNVGIYSNSFHRTEKFGSS